jgi:hypothetical protein
MKESGDFFVLSQKHIKNVELNNIPLYISLDFRNYATETRFENSRFMDVNIEPMSTANRGRP